MQNKVLILLGHSNAGKDFTLKELVKRFKFNPCISHTTRPKRPTEVDGVDYHFVSDEEFSNINFIETREYNTFVNIDGLKTKTTWKYGLAVSELDNLNTPRIVIVDLNGMKDIYEYLNGEVVLIYLECDEKIRMDRALSRNGESIDEIKRRFLDDKRAFKDVENIVRTTVNTNQHISSIVEQIMEVYNYHN